MINIEERIVELNPKKFKNPRVTEDKKYERNLGRGSRHFLKCISGPCSIFRFSLESRLKDKKFPEQELLDLIQYLNLNKLDEDPKEILNAFCSDKGVYVGSFFSDYFKLVEGREEANNGGKKYYKVEFGNWD